MVEIVLAMSVLMACAFVFSAAFPTSTANRQKADNHALALTMANREMAALRDEGYGVCSTYSGLSSAGVIDASPTSVPYSFTNVTQGSAQTVANVLPSGTGSLTVTTVSTGVIRLSVVVRWTEQGQSRFISLSSYLANVE